MIDVEVIEDPAAAAVALDPVRARLLAELREPGSAATLAARVGLARQKVNYHLRALEAHGLVRVAEERRHGGLTERVLQATAASYVITPIGDPMRAADRLSARYLIALAARIVREVGALARRDERAAARSRSTPRSALTRPRRVRGRAHAGRHAGHLRPPPRRRRAVPVARRRPPEGGRMTRRIENPIEVPGTPEEVWEAIATGHGIECWFVPAQVQDGRVALDMGGGMEDAGPVTASEPPHRFVYEEELGGGRGRAAGAARVGVPRRGQGRRHLRRAARQHAARRRRGLGRGAGLDVQGLGDVPAQPARLPHALPGPALRHGDGLGHAASGRRSWPRSAWPVPTPATTCAPPTPRCSRAPSSTAASASCCSGWSEPAPGLGLVYAYDWQGTTRTIVHLYLFEDSADVAEREAPAWRDWMAVPSAG